MEIGLLLMLVSMMNLVVILSQSIFKGENPTYVIWGKKTQQPTFNAGLYSDIYRSISFKLCLMKGTTKPCILI